MSYTFLPIFMILWLLLSIVSTNSYGQKIYKIEADLSKYDHIIFNNGGSSQTLDIAIDEN